MNDPRVSRSGDNLTAKDITLAQTIGIGLAVVGTLVGAVIASMLITGHIFYPPTATPSQINHIQLSALVSGFVFGFCGFAATKLAKKYISPQQRTWQRKADCQSWQQPPRYGARPRLA